MRAILVFVRLSRWARIYGVEAVASLPPDRDRGPRLVVVTINIVSAILVERKEKCVQRLPGLTSVWHSTFTHQAEALCAAAEPGEILVSEELRRGAGPSFIFTEAAPVSVPGRKEPMLAFRVVSGGEVEVETEPVTLTTKRPG